jgi:hypothetical protein
MTPPARYSVSPLPSFSVRPGVPAPRRPMTLGAQLRDVMAWLSHGPPSLTLPQQLRLGKLIREEDEES